VLFYTVFRQVGFHVPYGTKAGARTIIGRYRVSHYKWSPPFNFMVLEKNHFYTKVLEFVLNI